MRRLLLLLFCSFLIIGIHTQAFAASDFAGRFVTIQAGLTIYPGAFMLNLSNYSQEYAGSGTAFTVDYTGTGGLLFDFQADGSSVFRSTKAGTGYFFGPLTTYMLGLWDTDRSHALVVKWDEDDSADRVLNVKVAGGTRTLTIEADSLINQDVTTDAAPTFSAFDINLPATDNINIDGSSNPRNMTLGAMRFLHTPAIPDTRAIHIDVDDAGQSDTHGIFVSLSSTGLVSGESSMGMEVALDTSNATGGSLDGFRVVKAGAGTADVHGLRVDPGVDPIHQEVGSYGAIEQGWDENGGFTDTTAAFNDPGTDVVIFSANGDKIYIGDASDFNSLRVNLVVTASGAGVRPAFEYSIAGPAWTAFTPNDGTNGFRVSSTISWDETAFVAWVAVNVNGATKKYIRITRTQVGLGTAPTEDTIQVLESVEYEWDENGDLDVREITFKNENFIPVGDIVPTADGGDNAIVDIRVADPTNRRLYNRTTGITDTQDMDWYGEKAVNQTPTSLTIWTRASDFANCAMTMQVWDQEGNADATGAVTITPTGNDTWEEFTYTITSTYVNDEELWIKIAETSLDTGDSLDFSRIKVIY